MKTYSEKLRDPKWQRKRLEIMQRDEFLCTFCFDSETTLNVHHHYYLKGKDPWDYPDSALTTLCENCHKDIEQRRLEIMQSLTWEVPLDAVHRLAVNVDPWMLSTIATALLGCSGDETSDQNVFQVDQIDVAIKNLRYLKKRLNKK